MSSRSELHVRGTAVVTGAAGGIGGAYVAALLEAGAHVASADIDADGLEALERRLEESGLALTHHRSYVLDQTDVAALPAALDRVEADLGPLRILVNNAAIGNMRPTLDFTEAEFDRMVAINQKGPFFLAQEAGRRMIAHGDGGRIVNIASGAALRVVDNNNLYAMTKAALVFLTGGLAKEWGRHGINTNCICPGFIDTPLNTPVWATPQGQEILRTLPRGRLGQPQDLAAMLVFLASEEAGFVNGAVIPVDDGFQHVFPF
jgi:NAD(P)-dependent dehydrogenase (short-subunit alcohol dehydrogenase family)